MSLNETRICLPCTTLLALGRFPSKMDKDRESQTFLNAFQIEEVAFVTRVVATKKKTSEAQNTKTQEVTENDLKKNQFKPVLGAKPISSGPPPTKVRFYFSNRSFFPIRGPKEHVVDDSCYLCVANDVCEGKSCSIYADRKTRFVRRPRNR